MKEVEVHMYSVQERVLITQVIDIFTHRLPFHVSNQESGSIHLAHGAESWYADSKVLEISYLRMLKQRES